LIFRPTKDEDYRLKAIAKAGDARSLSDFARSRLLNLRVTPLDKEPHRRLSILLVCEPTNRYLCGADTLANRMSVISEGIAQNLNVNCSASRV
jgi:hypothetical protein